MKAALENKRAIPSLDGLRAVSVFAVILDHTRSPVLDRIPFSSAFRNGHQGVSCFFVISGFLITHLLVKEWNRSQEIDLKRFYLRRTLRIFPPFYVFLISVAILHLLGLIPLNGKAFLAAATYTWNYASTPGSTVLEHCWSLALEEQFYLLWPLCIAAFSKRINVWIAAGVIALSPLSRVITYFAWPSMRTHIYMMLHTHLDTIMTGCLLSLLIDLKQIDRFFGWAMKPFAVTASLLFLLTFDNWAASRWHGMYSMTVGYSLENLAFAILVLFVVFRHESLLGKFLNLSFIRHLGLISYSLYLWQQVLTGPYTFFAPLNILALIVVAELSYFFVELRSLQLRDRIERWFWPKPEFSSPSALDTRLAA